MPSSDPLSGVPDAAHGEHGTRQLRHVQVAKIFIPGGYMLIRTLFVVAALPLAATLCFASAPKGPVGPNGITVTPNGLAIATRPSELHFSQAPVVEPGLTKIFDNLSRYPDGVYWCCTSSIVSGPDSEFGSQSWIASPFTPNANLTVSKIVLGLSLVSGKNAVVVTLNSDSGGLPGSELASATVSGLPDFPGCCAVAQAKVNGVPVSAGQQYWVVVKTNHKDSTTLAGWNFNDTEQVILGNAAVNTGFGWQPLQTLALPAFEVLGK
jgi:hypothetical protein